MKYLLLIPFFLFLAVSALAQSSETPEAKEKKEEVGKPEPKKEEVKAVPASKGNNAKPQRVERPNKKGARPDVRPARSPRPVNRTNRPGRGR